MKRIKKKHSHPRWAERCSLRAEKVETNASIHARKTEKSKCCEAKKDD